MNSAPTMVFTVDAANIVTLRVAGKEFRAEFCPAGGDTRESVKAGLISRYEASLDTVTYGGEEMSKVTAKKWGQRWSCAMCTQSHGIKTPPAYAKSGAECLCSECASVLKNPPRLQVSVVAPVAKTARGADRCRRCGDETYDCCC